MIRSISALMLISVLAMSACALDSDGAGEIAKTSAGGGGASDVVDASAGIPDLTDHDGSPGTGSAILVGAGADGAQDAAVVSTPDAGVITDSSPPLGPPKPGEKKEAGKE